MTLRHICSWEHQLLQEKNWALMRLLKDLVSHLGKKLLLPGLLDVMLCERDMQEP